MYWVLLHTTLLTEMQCIDIVVEDRPLCLPVTIASRIGIVNEYLEEQQQQEMSPEAASASDSIPKSMRFPIVSKFNRKVVGVVIDWLLLQLDPQAATKFLSTMLDSDQPYQFSMDSVRSMLMTTSPSKSPPADGAADSSGSSDSADSSGSADTSDSSSSARSVWCRKPTIIEKPLRGILSLILQPWENEFLSSLENERFEVVTDSYDREVRIPTLLFEVVEVAMYLQVDELFQLLCAKIASDIREMSVEQIRIYLKQENDISPQERAEIEEENRWITMDMPDA